MANIAGGTGPIPSTYKYTEENGCPKSLYCEFLMENCASVSDILQYFNMNGWNTGLALPDNPYLCISSREITGVDVGIYKVAFTAVAWGDIEATRSGVIKLHGALESVETYVDVNGIPTQLSWFDASQMNQLTGTVGVWVYQTCPVTTQWPRYDATVTKIVDTSSPGSYLGQWIGKLNLDYWLGGPRGTWLCMTGSSKMLRWGRGIATGNTYMFQFQFAWQPKMIPGIYSPHNAIARLVDPRNGRPPPQGDLSNAIKEVACHKYVDFNKLCLATYA